MHKFSNVIVTFDWEFAYIVFYKFKIVFDCLFLKCITFWQLFCVFNMKELEINRKNNIIWLDHRFIWIQALWWGFCSRPGHRLCSKAFRRTLILGQGQQDSMSTDLIGVWNQVKRSLYPTCTNTNTISSGCIIIL